MLRYPSTKDRRPALLCVAKQIVIARENGTERGSEILAKFRCLGGSLPAANGVGIMSCGAGDRHQIGWNVMLHRGQF
jgi:hypothetical protein